MSALSHPTVIIVEDEYIVRDLAAEEFRSAGYEVVEFDTAELAANYMEMGVGDVVGVFTDVQTPGAIDGLDLAEFVRRRWPDLAVMITSGGRRVGTCVPPGAVFIQKPWQPSEVVRQFRKLAG